MKNIGSRVEATRKELSLSYRALSEKSGVPPSTIKSIENGSDPQLSNVAGLARGLGVEFIWLALGRGSRKRAPGHELDRASIDDLLLIGIEAALDDLRVFSPAERHRRREASLKRAHEILASSPPAILEEIGDLSA